MELKDVILSTIAELGEDIQKSTETGSGAKNSIEEGRGGSEPPALSGKDDEGPQESSGFDGELEFLQNMRERLLVLFEGFQSPNNKRVEAKIELTLNFLEYLLATIDERIDLLKRT